MFPWFQRFNARELFGARLLRRFRLKNPGLARPELHVNPQDMPLNPGHTGRKQFLHHLRTIALEAKTAA